jgi:carbonic anhydrase/acetyltransferase-like protein (isoleucine patch superfamily)
MVARLHAALPAERKAVADSIVVEAIRTALAMTQAMAHRHQVDLTVPARQQRPGWPRWIGTTWQLLRAHLDGGLWQFQDGVPVGWRRQNGLWTHSNIDRLLAVAPDALERQRSEEQLYDCQDRVPPTAGSLARSAETTGGPPIIDDSAHVDPTAWIGPGCTLGKGVVVGPGAKVWNSRLEHCRVEPGAVVEGSTLSAASVEDGAVVRTCRVSGSAIGPRSVAQCADIRKSQLAAETTVSAFADVQRVRAAYGAILGGLFHDAEIDVYLMSMHLAGLCRHLRAVPLRVRRDGREIDVPAVPMIGGGAVIRGEAGRPVELQCSFIGSNSLLEPGSFVGFGSFILGQFGPDQGILPFTISLDNEPRHHQLGGVLGSMPSLVLTHYLPWTYNAAGVELAPAVAEMVRQAAAEGLAAVEWEQARRAGHADGSAERFARYKCLPAYSDEQLAIGLVLYRRAIESGAWEMAYADGQLRFTSPNGKWHERNGAAVWLQNNMPRS